MYIHQSFWSTANAGLRGEFVTLKVRRKKGLILSFYLKNLKKSKFFLRKRKEVIKISAINEIEKT